MKHSLEERRLMIDRSENRLSISEQCRLLSLHRSGLYYRPCGESEENLRLMKFIDEFFLESPFTGTRKMLRYLERAHGMKVNRKRMRRLYRLMGLHTLAPKPKTTIPGQGHTIYPYLLKGLVIDKPNQVWAADITYIPMRKGFLYLIAIIDLHSRFVINWSLSNTMDAEWCAEMLREAIRLHGCPQIFNTDQGSQFTSEVFTTVQTVTQVTATFESSAQATEATNFLNYPSGSHINPVASNAHTGSYSEYLNGAASGQVGVAKSFSVMPGDVVQIQAYAKYSTPTGNPSNLANFALALLGAFNLSTPAQGETGTARSAINAYGVREEGGYGDGDTDSTDPKVFVTILIFDRNYNFVDVAYQQLTSSGFMSASYTVKQPGYAYMYISNEQAYQTDVYFDDVTMTFTASPVVQQQDFYAFGLSFNSYSRQSSVPQNYQYNGKELQNDLSLDWYDYGARMYMPEIGRWGVIR